MGLLDMAKQQGAGPEQQQGNPLQAAILIAHEVMYGDAQRNQTAAQRLADGKGDLLDECGELAAQVCRSAVRTARKRGTPVPPGAQMQLLVVTASMAVEFAEQLGLIKPQQEEFAARKALDSAERYFRKYGAQDNQQGVRQ